MIIYFLSNLLFNLYIAEVIISTSSCKFPPEQKKIFVSSANSTSFTVFVTLHNNLYMTKTNLDPKLTSGVRHK